MELEDSKSQRLLRTATKQCFLGMIVPLHELTATVATYTRLDQASKNSNMDWEGAHKAPLLAEKLWAVNGCQGRNVSFPLGCSWVVAQDTVNGLIPTKYSQHWLDSVVKKRTYRKLGGRASEEDMGAVEEGLKVNLMNLIKTRYKHVWHPQRIILIFLIKKYLPNRTMPEI